MGKTKTPYHINAWAAGVVYLPLEQRERTAQGTLLYGEQSVLVLVRLTRLHRRLSKERAKKKHQQTSQRHGCRAARSERDELQVHDGGTSTILLYSQTSSTDVTTDEANNGVVVVDAFVCYDSTRYLRHLFRSGTLLRDEPRRCCLSLRRWRSERIRILEPRKKVLFQHGVRFVVENLYFDTNRRFDQTKQQLFLLVCLVPSLLR